MDFDLSRARDLFIKGHFSSLSQAAGSDVAQLKRLQPESRVLIAHTCVYTGRVKLASELTQSVQQAGASSSTLAESHIVLGLIRKREGRIEEAATEFRQAARIAKEAGDKNQLAWAQAHLFRMLSSGHPESHLTALLADVRKAVSNAGDAHVTAYLHDSVASMEAQKGHTVEADRHLRVARSLLALRPNAWLEQLVALNSSCLAIIDCDASAFGKHIASARTFAKQTGHVNSDAAIETNDAHVALVSGHFDDASTLLRRVLQEPVSIFVQLAALEGMARMHMALGDLVSCQRSLENLDHLKRGDLTLSFSFRSAATIKVKLLIRRDEWADAAELAKSQLSEFEKVNDTLSLVALKTLRAVALVHLGNYRECCRELLDASRLGANSLREHQAEYAHACSLVWKQVKAPEPSPFETRSFRIWSEHGNRCGPLEAITAQGHTATNDSVAEELLKKHSPSDHPTVLEPEHRVVVIDHLASAFDLAYNPQLLARELMLAIRSCDLSPDVQLLKAGRSDEPNRRSMILGTLGGKSLKLVCEIPDDPVKAILLGDILRIGRAAIALERAREEERSRAALWPADPVEDQGDAIFIAEEMQTLLATARRIAPTNVPVLITGETGTGKEVLARTIHACSSRASATFLPFNCTSTPRDMLDSQLFGHRRGAFTGAVDHFQGVIRAAAGGTLFLDEIGDTSLEVQPKLLRFLEAHEVHPIGETHPSKVDVRVIVATNADLDALVTDGRFREDLFYRLSIVRLHLPPLRQRRVEIPTLANHYLQKHALEYSKGDLRLSEDTMEYLMLYRWPGNVRQLANEMRRLAALAETSAVLMPEHLSPEIAASRRTIPASERVLEPTEVVVRLDQPMAAAVTHLEQTMLQYALKKCDGRIEDTAAMLGLSRKGLYLKRQRFGIEPPIPVTANT